jgi:hypothetical protein
LTFDELELGNLGFHLLRLHDRRVDRGLVFGNAGCERSDEAPLGFIDPRFELNLSLLSDHRMEGADEGLGIRQHWDSLFDGGETQGEAVSIRRGIARQARNRQAADGFGEGWRSMALNRLVPNGCRR